MNSHILLVGGAGFIGSHTADALIERGYRVRILDSLLEQVHPEGTWPSYLNPEIELIKGDVRNATDVKKALSGIDIVFHLVSETGVSQSMFEVERYISTNVLGTAVLLEQIRRVGCVKKFVLASSRAIYGEGKAHCSHCGFVNPGARSRDKLKKGLWIPSCPTCGDLISDVSTDEDYDAKPISVYGMTKKHQEEICLLLLSIIGIPLIILRYFNVYGPRQSPTNPYTGVITSFLNCLRTGGIIPLYEEGLPIRDFVHVADVVQANLLAIEKKDIHRSVWNVGTGIPLRLYNIANELCRLIGRNGASETTNRSRIGDIFACYADIARIRNDLGFEPRTELKQGLQSLLDSVQGTVNINRSHEIERELNNMGLLIEKQDNK